ncbi:MAG: type II 3-dehydroquinate dehydratase [Clostridia bacterium]|nr:type II 3-dehydroquinate dehydratase [Clostridia bacterium]
MKILVINGPNLNLLGIREPEIYGKKNYHDLVQYIDEMADELNVNVTTFQSNTEGEIVNRIQEAYFEKVDGIIINPAAYTHTSIAIPDAIKAVGIPAVEVHLTDITKREEYRQKSYTKEACIKTFMGNGFTAYLDGMKYLLDNAKFID